MNTIRKNHRRFLSLAMALAMLLTMSVSAFAYPIQPYNANETTLVGKVNASTQTYSVTVSAPSNTTKIEMTATLYQKQLLGYKEIDTMTASANSWRCTKSESATIESGKTYKIEVVAEIYAGGVWDTVELETTVKT